MKSDILKTNLVHASGQEMVMLGGDVYEQLTKGDIVHEYKWRDGQPIMLIYKRVLGNNTPAYMIELKDAHQYATSSGGPTKALLSKFCFEAAKALRMEHDKFGLYRLIDVIVEGMDILLKMPPEPKAIEIANRPSTGNDELTLKIDGKIVAEVQL